MRSLTGLTALFGCCLSACSGDNAPGDSASLGGSSNAAGSGGDRGISGAGGGGNTESGSGAAGASAIGPNGCALEIPARGAIATISDTDALFGSEFTIELWVRFASIPPMDDHEPAPPPQFVTIAENAGSDTAFYVAYLYNEFGCVIRDSFVWNAATRPVGPPFAGAWHHVACVKDERGLHLWLDGVWETTSPEAPPYEHDGSPLILGAGIAGPAAPVQQSAFVGAIDEVVLYNQSLYSVIFNGNTVDADEFTPNAQASVTPSALGAWHFDECEGASAGDATASRRTAKLLGEARWLAP